MKIGYSFDSLVAFVNQINETTVKLTGDQTIAGVKTFSSNPLSSAVQSTLASALVRYDTLTAGLAKKADLAGATFTGEVVLSSVWPTLTFSETDSGKKYTLVADGGGIRLNEDSSSGTVAWNYNNADGFGMQKPHSLTAQGDLASALTRKDYVDGEVAKSLPLRGGTMLGNIVSASSKGALQLVNTASVAYVQGTYYFHNFSLGTELVWGSGAGGDTRLMSLDQFGTLRTTNALAGRTLQVFNPTSTAMNQFDITDAGLPRIISKTPHEIAGGVVALEFGNNEVLSPNKALASAVVRVANDGGLKFSSDMSLTGTTWGMGRNASDATLSISKYVNGAWIAQALSINADLSVQVGSRIDSPYLQLRAPTGNLPIMEWHTPGASAFMAHIPNGNDSLSFGASNGNGNLVAELFSIAPTIIRSFRQFHSAQRISTSDNGLRAWEAVGNSCFYAEEAIVGQGTLRGVVSGRSHFPGMHNTEYCYGNVASADFSESAHVLWTTNGAARTSLWTFRNGGELITPAGVHLETNGNLSGGVWGTNGLKNYIDTRPTWKLIKGGAISFRLPASPSDTFLGTIETGISTAGRTFDPQRYKVVLYTEGSVATPNPDTMWWSAFGTVAFRQGWYAGNVVLIKVYGSSYQVTDGYIDRYELYEFV